VKGWKVYQGNSPRKQAGLAMLMSDKEDFKHTLVKLEQRRSLHTNKKCNTSKGNNNHQLIWTQCQWTQLHHTYTKGLKKIIQMPTQW
jgi:hypothetical protein